MDQRDQGLNLGLSDDFESTSRDFESASEDFEARTMLRELQEEDRAGKRAERRTPVGHGVEATKSGVRTLGSLPGTTLKGLDVLFADEDEIGEGSMAQLGERMNQAVEGAIELDSDYQDTLTHELGGSVGSLVGFWATGGTAGAVSRGGAALARAGSGGQRVAQRTGQFGTAGTMAIGASADEAYERAKQFGLPDDEAQNISRVVGPVAGPIQISNLGIFFRKLPDATRQRFMKEFGGRYLTDMANEAGVEGAASVIQNWGQMQYDEQQGLFDETAKRAMLGAFGAGTLQGARAMASRGRGMTSRGTDTDAPNPEDAPLDDPDAGFETIDDTADEGMDPESAEALSGLDSDAAEQAAQSFSNMDPEQAVQAFSQITGIEPLSQSPQQGMPQQTQAEGAPEADLDVSPDEIGQMIAELEAEQGESQPMQGLDMQGEQQGPQIDAEAQMEPMQAQTDEAPQPQPEPEGQAAQTDEAPQSPDPQALDMGGQQPQRPQIQADTDADTGSPVLQNRDRDRGALVQQVERIANEPDYQRVSVSRDPNSGAPMVFRRGQARDIDPADLGGEETITIDEGNQTRRVEARYAVVEADELLASHDASGQSSPEYGGDGLNALNNGRVIGLKEAHRRGNANQYREEMASDPAHGVAREAIDAKQNPVLVRVFDESQLEGIGDMGDASNAPLGASASATEQAMTDSRRIDDTVLNHLQPGDIGSDANAEFRRRMLANMNENEANQFLDGQQRTSSQGIQRMRAALAARAYNSKALVEQVMEQESDELRSLGDALVDAAGPWAQMRALARQEQINPEVDITDGLIQAVEMIRSSRTTGQSLTDIVSQQDAFSGPAPAVAVELLELFHRKEGFRNIRGRNQLAEILTEYSEQAMQTSPAPDLMGEMTGRDELLEGQRERTGTQRSGLAIDGSESEGEAVERPADEGALPTDPAEGTGDRTEGATEQPGAEPTTEAEPAGEPTGEPAGAQSESGPRGSPDTDESGSGESVGSRSGEGEGQSGSADESGDAEVEPSQDELDTAREETDTDPTDAQAEAGNYKKGRIRMFGQEIAIENPKGSTRRSRDPDNPWETEMQHDYGDIKGTIGADGDNIDVFIGPNQDSDKIFVVDQVDQGTGAFDEHKVMMGFNTKASARKAYRAHYPKGWKGGPVVEVEPSEFREWLQNEPGAGSFSAYARDNGLIAPDSTEAQSADEMMQAQPQPEAESEADAQPEAETEADTEAETETEPSETIMETFRRLDNAMLHSDNMADLSDLIGEAMRDTRLPQDARDILQTTYNMRRQQIKDKQEQEQREKRMQEQREAEAQAEQEAEQAERQGETLDQAVERHFGASNPAAKVSDWLNNEIQNVKRPKFIHGPGASNTYKHTKGGLTMARKAAQKVNTDTGNPTAIMRVSQAREWGSDGNLQPGDDGYVVLELPTTATAQILTERFDNSDVGINSVPGETIGFELTAEATPGEQAETGATQTGQSSSGTSWGDDNTFVTKDRASDLRQRLKQKLGGSQLNAGIDPEILAIGTELAAFHIEAGARRFGDFSRAIASDLGVSVNQIRPYLRSWYNGARDMMEDSGMDVADMDTADTVRAEVNKITEDAQAERQPTEQGWNSEAIAEQVGQGVKRVTMFDQEGSVVRTDLAPVGHPMWHDSENGAAMSNEAEALLEDSTYHNGQPLPIPEHLEVANILSLDGEFAVTPDGHLLDRLTPEGALQRELLEAPKRIEAVGWDGFQATVRIHMGGKFSRFTLAKSSPSPLDTSYSIIDRETGTRLGGAFGSESAYRQLAQLQSKLDAGQSITQETGDVSTSGVDVESDSTESAAGESVGATDVPTAPGSAGSSAGGSSGEADPGGVSGESDPGVSAGSTAGAGAQGDLPIHNDQGIVTAAVGATGDPESQGSGEADGGRAQSESSASDTTAEPSEYAESRNAEQRRAEQRAAESIPSETGDLANIRETLPMLLPEQQEDVHFAEQRLNVNNGHGVLFTNGTGTGKTFTGLGLVKRYHRDGRDNILIVVPNDKIGADWAQSAADLQVPAKQLENTQDNGGSGVVVTTYANFRQNASLFEREWDLLAFDESHYLRQKDAFETTQAELMRDALTGNERGHHHYHSMVHAEEIAERTRLRNAIASNSRIMSMADTMDSVRNQLKAENDQMQREHDRLNEKLQSDLAREREMLEKRWDENHTQTLMLSATPFPYRKSVDSAAGYLFEYGEDGDGRIDARDQFFIRNFGYRFRYNRLTEPDAEVNTDLMEREFSDWLRSTGAMKSRMLEVERDYDRRFYEVQDQVGFQIDEGMQWLDNRADELMQSEDMADQTLGESLRDLRTRISKNFDYLSRAYFLEAVKAKHMVDTVEQHLQLGRKVVVFHDFNKGGSMNPLLQPGLDGEIQADDRFQNEKRAYQLFKKERPDLFKLDLTDLVSPRERFARDFEGALFINGTVSKKKRRENIAAFNDDNSRSNLIVVQSDAGREGVSLHDQTGQHQRALINLGLPSKPIAAIQTEGRTYRTFVQTDAIQRYVSTGLNLERWAIAQKLAERSSTAENLAMGSNARGLKQSFLEAYEEAGEWVPGHEGEGRGGKQRDRDLIEAMSDFERAKTYYWGTLKNTKRRDQREGADYYATPEPLGVKMVEWGGIRNNDSVLEPSAGHGSILRFTPESAKVQFIEPESALASKAAMNAPNAEFRGRKFEDLDKQNKYDAILMNPPFGQGGATAWNHIELAANHMRDGSRIVALVPDGPAANKRMDKFLESKAAKNLSITAQITMPGVVFERAGASVKTKVLVMDRIPEGFDAPQQVRREVQADTANEFFDAIEGIEIPARPEAVGKPKRYNETADNLPHFESAQTTHAKRQVELYVAKVVNRISDYSDFKRIKEIAQRHNGYYSKFARSGAIPGFQFESEADRAAFYNEAQPIMDEIRTKQGGEDGTMVREVEGVTYYGVREEQLGLDFDAQASQADQPAQGRRRTGRLQQTVTTRQFTRHELMHGVDTVESGADAAHVLAHFRKDTQETLLALALDAKKRPLAVVRASKGTRSSSAFPAEDMMGDLLSIEGMESFWLSHNHPSGRLTPSPGDIAVTGRVHDMAENSGVKLEGHVLLGFGRQTTEFGAGQSSAEQQITARARRYPVPVLERRVTSDQRVEATTTPKDAIKALRRFVGPEQSGVMLMTNDMRPAGFLDMSGFDLENLRDSTAYREVIEAITETSAASFIAQVGNTASTDAGDNLAGLLNSLQDQGFGTPLQDVVTVTGTGKNVRYKSAAQAGPRQFPNTWFKINESGAYAQEMRSDHVQDRVNRITSGWANAPQINVVQGIDALPRELRDALTQAGAEAQVPGVFHRGQVYLIADNLRRTGEVDQVVMHEVVGHYGLRRLAGDQIKPLLNQVWAKMGGTKRARALISVYFPNNSFDPNNANHRMTIAEELLAQMAERGEHQSLMSRIAAVVQSALRAMGINIRMNATDMKQLLRRAQDTVANGGMVDRQIVDDAIRMQRAPRSEFTPDRRGARGRQLDRIGRIIERLDQQSMRAYNRGDLQRAEDIDARLAELREQAESMAAALQEDGVQQDFESSANPREGQILGDTVDTEASETEALADAYQRAYVDGDMVNEPMDLLRGAISDHGGNPDAFSDQAVFDAAQDAHQSIQNRRNPGGRRRYPSDRVVTGSGQPVFSRKSGDLDNRFTRFFDGIATQPVDRMFRALFDVFGAVDSHGKFRKGSEFYQAAKYRLIDARPNPNGMFGWMDGPIEIARAGLVDRHRLPQGVRRAYRQAEAVERDLLSQAQEIINKLHKAGMNYNESRVLQKMLTGEAIPDGEWAETANEVIRAVDQLGREAVNYGIISEAAYQRNRGKYLHRSYQKHEAQQTALSGFIEQLGRARRRRIVGDASKARGLDRKVSFDKLIENLPDGWWGIKKRDGKPDMQTLHEKEFTVLENPGEVQASEPLAEMDEGGRPRRVKERVYWPADRPIPARMQDWVNQGTYQVRRSSGNTVILNRDFTKAERERMGEILDARYNIAKTFETLSRDIAMGKFFQDISQNAEWFRSEEPEGVILGDGDRKTLAQLNTADWVKVPGTRVEGTGDRGPFKYGALAGGWVRPEIWRDINELDKMHQPGGWRQILTQWKLNKTARSPVVHMNNIMSNFMLMDMVDVRGTDFIRGLRSYINKDDHWHDAMKYGAFEGTLVNEELRRNVLEPALNELAQQKPAEGSMGFISQLSDFGYALNRYWRKYDQTTTGWYQAEDEIFRMATYMRRIELGDSPLEAAQIARDQFLDYDIRAPWVNAARRSVLPFISYTYRAVPVVAQSIAERPWKFAKYVTIAQLANAMAYELAPGDEDEERRTMRQQERGHTWIMTPRMLRMPWRDDNENPVFLDVRRWIPAGDVFDLNQGSSALPIPAPLQFGGPIMLGAELALDKIAFTGEQITEETDTPGQRASKVGDWLYKSWMPSAAYIPGSWYWEKIGTAAQGGRDIVGRPYSITQAAASSLGVKLKPHDVELGYAFRSMDLNAQRRKIQNEARTLQRDLQRNLISQSDYEAGAETVRQKQERLREQARELYGRD